MPDVDSKKIVHYCARTDDGRERRFSVTVQFQLARLVAVANMLILSIVVFPTMVGVGKSAAGQLQ